MKNILKWATTIWGNMQIFPGKSNSFSNLSKIRIHFHVQHYYDKSIGFSSPMKHHDAYIKARNMWFNLYKTFCRIESRLVHKFAPASYLWNFFLSSKHDIYIFCHMTLAVNLNYSEQARTPYGNVGIGTLIEIYIRLYWVVHIHTSRGDPFEHIQ